MIDENEMWEDERRLLYGDNSVWAEMGRGLPLEGPLGVVLCRVQQRDAEGAESLSWMVLDTLQRLERAGGRMGAPGDGTMMMKMEVPNRVVFWRWPHEAVIRPAVVQRMLSLWGCLHHARMEEWQRSRG